MNLYFLRTLGLNTRIPKKDHHLQTGSISGSAYKIVLADWFTGLFPDKEISMVFICRQCGECCMYLGDYIVINDQIGEFTFSCESVSTGTLFSASVDQDKRAIYANRTLQDMHPSACPFLRPDGHLIRCTIHRDSPVQCKAYRCTAIRIIGEGGRLIGRVTGTLALHSDDPRLREIWNEIEKGRPVSDCDAEEWIASFLKMRGYRIE